MIGMSNTLLVDTDVLIGFLRGNKKAIAFIDKYSPHIILSPIVVAELYAGVKGAKELAVLDNFISLFRMIPIDADIAKAGGLYKRDFNNSHGVGIADAILAATVNKENAELKTLNVKHYPMISGLNPAYKKNGLTFFVSIHVPLAAEKRARPQGLYHGTTFRRFHVRSFSHAFSG